MKKFWKFKVYFLLSKLMPNESENYVNQKYLI